MNIKALIGILISLGLVVWLIFAVNWQEVLGHLSKIHYWLLIPYTFVILLQFALRAYRWQFLVPDRNSMGFKLSLDGIMIGNFINYILPLRAGEIARPFFLSRFSKNSFPANFAALIIERFFDLSIVLVLFYYSLSGLNQIPEWVTKGATVLLFLALGILLFIITACFSRNYTEKIIVIICKYLPRFAVKPIANLLNGILEGTTVIKSKKNLFIVIMLSVAVWLVTIWGYYALLLIFEIPASFSDALVITVVIALAVAAPSAPGFIGVLQTGCIVGFALVGLDQDLAMAYALITHFHMYLVIIIYGMIILYQYGLNITDLRQKNDD